MLKSIFKQLKKVFIPFITFIIPFLGKSIRYIFYKILLFLVNILISIQLIYKEIIISFVWNMIRRFMLYFVLYSLLFFFEFLGFLLAPIVIPLLNLIGFFLVKIIHGIVILAENLCYLHYFVWEIAELKKHKRTLCFLLYLTLLTLLWTCYWLFIPIWYDALNDCIEYQGFAKCGQMLFCLTYTTFFLFEFLRILKYFLEEYVINSEDSPSDKDKT